MPKVLERSFEKLRKRGQNRYWRILHGSGFLCDRCKNWTNYLGAVENKKTGERLCAACYERRIK